jgi:DNA-binding GntR family transcriptional regulator
MCNSPFWIQYPKLFMLNWQHAPPAHQTLPQRVAEILRATILAGKLVGGQTLRQEELAAQLGVSRIPVREALRQLEAEGFVELHPHRGATVATLTPSEALEIYDIRAALEAQALRLAVPNLTKATLRSAEDLLDKIDGETGMARWAELNWQFHATLYAAAQRPRLLEMIRQLHDNVGRYLRSAIALPAHTRQSQKQHRALLAACKRRDAPAAVAVLEDHLRTTSSKLAAQLEARNGPHQPKPQRKPKRKP